VFRATLLSIVLTLAVGQNAALLCKVGCHSPDATSAECHHQDSTTPPSVRGDDRCNTAAAGAVVFVRQDARRTASAPDTQNAVSVPRFRFVTPPADSRSGYNSTRQLLLEERPLIALRI
jgi:hypothetical protein